MQRSKSKMKTVLYNFLQIDNKICLTLMISLSLLLFCNNRDLLNLLEICALAEI